MKYLSIIVNNMKKAMTLGKFLTEKIDIPTSVGMFIASLVGAVGMLVFLTICNLIIL